MTDKIPSLRPLSFTRGEIVFALIVAAIGAVIYAFAPSGAIKDDVLLWVVAVGVGSYAGIDTTRRALQGITRWLEAHYAHSPDDEAVRQKIKRLYPRRWFAFKLCLALDALLMIMAFYLLWPLVLISTLALWFAWFAPTNPATASFISHVLFGAAIPGGVLVVIALYVAILLIAVGLYGWMKYGAERRHIVVSDVLFGYEWKRAERQVEGRLGIDTGRMAHAH